MLTQYGYAQELQSAKIWDKAPHNAFTDLVRYKSWFFLCFRESGKHVPSDPSDNGRIRILRSRDGIRWDSVALLSDETYDLRDPKLSVTPEGRLMVIMGGSQYSRSRLLAMKPHVSFSPDGRTFSAPEPVSLENDVRTNFDWIWRTTWHNGIGYAIAYQTRLPGNKIRLVTTKDGLSYYQLREFDLDSLPNESTIRFDSEARMLILVRREGGANGMLGISEFPYSDWSWSHLSYRLGGPDFVITSDQMLLIGTRLYEPGSTSTVIRVTDLQGRTLKLLTLPSGGDTSYPGMLIFRNRLYVSYYSSHEGKSSIYFTSVSLNELSPSATE